MATMKKFYFMREQRAAEMAEDEESARLMLAEVYGDDTEDFILMDVKDMIEIAPGEWKVFGQ
jgi:hypothetical protein